VLELAIVRLLQKQLGGRPLAEREPGKVKIVYMAPIKALCQERREDWQRRFDPLGVRSACTLVQPRRAGGLTAVAALEMTGDSESIRSRDIRDKDIMCACGGWACCRPGLTGHLQIHDA
jgi:ATP-dependent DNA helicase HFM1/MER3